MNKIKIRYSLRRFDLPESFNQSDVMIEVPFEYGMINIYPYYDTILLNIIAMVCYHCLLCLKVELKN